MTYQASSAAADASMSLPHGGRVPTWSWQQVEDRMAEAMRHWWRSPDSEARFSLGGRISSIWRQSFTDRLALIDQLDVEAPPPPTLPLSRDDMARMLEASEWLAHIREDDRRLVVLALVYRAKGEKKLPWLKIKRRLGVPFGADGLRKRYSRAITDVANVLNGGKPRGLPVKPPVAPSSK